jgi:hypothetical protein
MQKWDYLTIYVINDKTGLKVLIENNASLLEKSGLMSISDLSAAPSFVEYAHEKGQEGWELTSTVSANPGDTGGTYFYVIFKRPLAE